MRVALAVPAAVALTAASVLALWNALASRSARRRLRRGATLVQVGDRSVHVEDTAASGRGAVRDYTVVLDAGLGMSSLSWGWVRDSIARSGVRVITFDRPGIGRSPAKLGAPWLRRVDELVKQVRALFLPTVLSLSLVVMAPPSFQRAVGTARLDPGPVKPCVGGGRCMMCWRRSGRTRNWCWSGTLHPGCTCASSPSAIRGRSFPHAPPPVMQASASGAAC